MSFRIFRPLLLLLALLLALSLSACSSGTAPGSSKVAKIPEPPVLDEENDPTLNHDLIYRHDDYLYFGDPETYKKVLVPLKDAGTQESANVYMRFPERLYLSAMDILYDGNFAEHVKIKSGGFYGTYYQLESGETAYSNSRYSLTKYSYNSITKEDVTLIETKENIPGGYCYGDNFLRVITHYFDNNNVINYVVDLGNDHITSLYFYVSDTATEEDLALYDAIISSTALYQS